jgi:hypothetical protein
MEQIDTSQFKVYSYGIAADNKAISSKMLNVSPIEIIPMADGELASNPNDVKSSGIDKDGNSYQSNITNDNVIECTWLPFGTNRVTPPDVRRGEPVLIWNYGGTDKYYWTSIGLADDLRRLETVVYAINGNPNTESKEFDPEDHYFVETSTHSKQITLRTSNKNGEPFKYVFQFNTDVGVVTLADDVDNFFELNSKETTMKLELNTDTKVHLDKMKILINANEEVKIVSGATNMIWTPANTTLITPRFIGIGS